MAKNTIKIKKYSDNIFEKLAAAVITPGMLLERTSLNKVQAHSTSEGNASPKTFALEDELQGNGIDDAYSADDQVQCWIPAPGDQVYALLADGETAVIGSKLSSNGAGRLKVHDPDDSGSIQVEGIVATALEAVDMSGSSGADSDGRIEVEVA